MPIPKDRFPRTLAVQNLVWEAGLREALRPRLHEPDLITSPAFGSSVTAELWRDLDGTDSDRLYLPRPELIKAFYEKEVAPWEKP